MSKIIELRDNDSKDNSEALEQCGEYTVNFDHFEMNKGDSLGIRSCFLDTRSTTQGKIKIDSSNNEVTLSHYIYLTDLFQDSASDANLNFIDEDGENITHPDGKRYILSKKVETNLQYFSLTSFSYPLSSFDDTNPKTTHGGFDVVLQYNAPDPQNPDGKIKKTVTLNAIKSSAPVFCSYQGKKDFQIVMVGPNIADAELKVLNGTDLHRKAGIDLDEEQSFDVTVGPSIAGDTIEPLMMTYKFTLDDGNYAPADLAKTITDKFIVSKTVPTGNNTGIFTFTDDEDSIGTQFSTENPYFTHIAQLKDEAANYGSLGGGDPQLFVREDGKSILEINASGKNADGDFPDSRLVGCSELSLQYNPDTQKFVFSQLHQPIFETISGSTVQVNKLIKEIGGGGPDDVRKRSYIGESGGIVFTNLSGNTSFFLQDLGFSPDLFVAPEQGVNSGTFGSQGNVTTRALSLINGTNVTSSITGADTIVDKSNYEFLPPDSAITNVASINSYNIFGSTPTSEAHLKDGYFLIEIEGIPNTKILNNKSPNIQAIVSRYYATQDFVIMEGYSGSIPYVHNSDVPLVLSSVRVRILDANGQIVSQLGPNNTVFLEYKPSNL